MKVALVRFRGVGLDHATRAAMRAPSRALPRRRALCTSWKKLSLQPYEGARPQRGVLHRSRTVGSRPPGRLRRANRQSRSATVITLHAKFLPNTRCLSRFTGYSANPGGCSRTCTCALSQSSTKTRGWAAPGTEHARSAGSSEANTARAVSWGSRPCEVGPVLDHAIGKNFSSGLSACCGPCCPPW